MLGRIAHKLKNPSRKSGGEGSEEKGEGRVSVSRLSEKVLEKTTKMAVLSPSSVAETYPWIKKKSSTKQGVMGYKEIQK